MAFDALWLQNVDYPARIDRTVFDSIWSEGVLGLSALQVTQSAVPAMTVDVAAGTGIVQGDDEPFQGKYVCREEAATTGLSIAAAPGSGSRHDLVVLQVRDPNATGPAGDDAILSVITGTPSGSPVDPAIPNSALVLARVRVPAGTGTITNSLIDDLRTEARVVGTSPIGSVISYAGAVAPSGWLICDGQAVSQSTYADLYAVIGSTYDTAGGQSAPGAGLFRVPLLTGRVPVGKATAGTFASLAATGGAETVTLTTGEMPAHTHVQDAHNHGNGTLAAGSDGVQHTHSVGSLSTGTTGGTHSHTAGSNTTGSHDHVLEMAAANSTSHYHSTVADRVATKPITTTSTHDSDDPVQLAGSHSHTITVNTTNSGHGHTLSGSTGNSSAHLHTHPVSGAMDLVAATNQSTGGGAAHDNLQPYIVLNYIIKA